MQKVQDMSILRGEAMLSIFTYMNCQRGRRISYALRLLERLVDNVCITLKSCYVDYHSF